MGRQGSTSREVLQLLLTPVFSLHHVPNREFCKFHEWLRFAVDGEVDTPSLIASTRTTKYLLESKTFSGPINSSKSCEVPPNHVGQRIAFDLSAFSLLNEVQCESSGHVKLLED